MAGKVRPAAQSYGELVAQQAYAEALAPTGSPTDDTLKQRIHLAILQRLRRFHPEEYAFCMEAVGRIAKYEEAKRLTEEEAADGIAIQLGIIATATPTSPPHIKELLERQQAVLRDLLAEDQYDAARTLIARINWFRAHWEQLTAISECMPCNCRYRVTLAEFIGYANGRPKDLSTTANAADFYLAFIHRLTTVSAANLRKALTRKALI